MGVKGLWRLLLPIGRRISIETLEGKVLAIDASIWLTQFLKAMRDPDSGRVQAAAHLIGFFRRICRLRFHGIKPVFVFDGATPEIKRREVLLRRRRREQFAKLGDATVQRMARRLLAETLKKQKLKALPSNEEKKKAKPSNTAFAEGFNPGAQEEGGGARATGEAEPVESNNAKEVDLGGEISDKEPLKNKDEDIYEIKETIKEEITESKIDVDYEIALSEHRAEDVNDWDLPLPDDSQGDNGTTNSDKDSDNESSYNDWRVSDPNDIAQIFVLPANKRKDAIEHAKRQQRLQSRKEFMPAAGNPMQFSQVQLANFLRSTRLNKSIEKMAIEAVKKDNQGLRGELMASDRTTRVELLREDDEESSTDRGGILAKKQRTRKRRRSESSSSDEEWSSHDAIHGNDKSNIQSPRQKNAVSKKRQNVIDDSDSSVDTSVEQPGTATLLGSQSNERNEVFKHHVLDDLKDEISVSEEGGFIPQLVQQSLDSSRSALDPSNSLSTKDVISTENTIVPCHNCDDSGSEGGGFIKQPPLNDSILPHVSNSIKPCNLEDSNHEITDRILAEKMQMIEYGQDSTLDSERASSANFVESNGNVLVDLTSDPGCAQSKIEIAKPSKKKSDAVDNDTEDEDIDWEDGDDENDKDHDEIEEGQDMEQDHEHSNDERNALDSEWGNVVDSGESISHETQEALERAQATASRLADWAGRVFKRAMKDASGPAIKKSLTDSQRANSDGDEKDTGPTPFKSGNRSSDKEVDNQALPVINVNTDDEDVKSGVEEILDLTALHSSNRQVEDLPIINISDQRDAKSSLNSMTFSNMERLEAFLDDVQEDESKWEEDRRKRERDMDTVTDDMREEAIRLLQLFGVPYVEAPAEAEAQCAALEELGLVDGIVTEDSDVFVFGGQTVFKNIFDEQKYAEVYKACDAEREMSLSRNHMVALAMLLGGDYTQGVKGVGIVNAMEIFEAFDVSVNLKGGLDEFKTWLDGFDPFEHSGHEKIASSKRAVFYEKHKSGRNRWIAPEGFPSENILKAYLHPVVDKSSERFSWGAPDVDNLLAFCTKNIGWRPEDTMRLLEPVLEKLSNKGMRQTRIDAFMRYEDTIKFADVRSQRLKEVFKSKVNKETK